MCRLATRLIIASWLALTLFGNAYAVRIMTNPTSIAGDPGREFDNIALTSDGLTIIATGRFNTALGGDRLYSLTIPTDPVTQTATITQLSTQSFAVSQQYDVNFAPVISPDGQKILFIHDANLPGDGDEPNFSIFTVPIGGDLNGTSHTGLFGAAPNNVVAPGNGGFDPIYSPDGSTIFFLNRNAGYSPDPIFDPGPIEGTSWSAKADWHLIYSVPAAGGTPTAITQRDDGAMELGLYKVTPDGLSIVYAPDVPIRTQGSISRMRPKLFSIPTTGGTPTEIPIPAPPHEFDIEKQLEVTSDGQHILFIADYELTGRNELWSVPIIGGTPTRISDDIPWDGDVTSFVINPAGTHVAYVAGQNTGGNGELFLTPITGGSGNSIRVSEPPPSNLGEWDVSSAQERLGPSETFNRDDWAGQVVFSPDGTKLYYLGDFTMEAARELHVVDTTEKIGLTPSPYYYTGPTGGDFFDEANWNDKADGTGNNPPGDPIRGGFHILINLIIDGDTVGSSGGEIDIQRGGSLEMTAGSVLMLTNSNDQFDINPDGAFKFTDATLIVDDDITLEGTTLLSGGLIESLKDDIEFQDDIDADVHGTMFRTGAQVGTGGLQHFHFDQSVLFTNATFETKEVFSMRYDVNVHLTDSTLDVNGGISGIEDVFVGAQGLGARLTLDGTSTLLANGFDDGVSLVLDGTSVATLLGNNAGGFDLIDPNDGGTITFMSTGAELITLNASATDARALVINGLTGLSYLADPSAWNVTNWDGLTALTSLMLVSAGPDGDYNDDGKVDAADYVVWRKNPANFGGDPGGYNTWRANFGMMMPGSGGGQTINAVPEPSALCLTALLAMAGASRHRSRPLRRWRWPNLDSVGRLLL